MEAEMGEIRPLGAPPGAGRGSKAPSPEPPAGARPCPHLDFRLLACRTVREQILLAVSPQCSVICPSSPRTFAQTGHAGQGRVSRSSSYHSPQEAPGGEVDQLCSRPTPEANQQLSQWCGAPSLPPTPALMQRGPEAEQRTAPTQKEGAEC